MAGAPMIIRARVRAWLLGIRLLTLEAWITAGSDGAPVPGMPSVGRRDSAARPGDPDG